MVAEAVAVAEPETTEAKYDDARRRLTDELQKIADEVTFLDPNRPEWKPLLDSRRVVGTVLVLEDLFPVKIPPDKLVRKGGYNDVKEAVEDIIRRHKRLAAEQGQAEKGAQMSKEREKQPDPGDEDRKALGERLREAREYLGFSQDQVATFLGVPRSALSLMETGQRKVEALELKKLAGLYKRPVGYFTGEEEEELVRCRRQAPGPQGRGTLGRRPRGGGAVCGLPASQEAKEGGVSRGASR